MKTKKWIINIFILTFFISIVFNLFTNVVITSLNIYFSIIILIFMILIGVVFDIIGVAILADKESHHHARATKKAKGAKTSVFLLKNADKVSNVCNDVIGDISGIISGGIGALVALTLHSKFNVNIILINLLIGSFIASLTVGLKAIGKTIAIKHSKKIVEIIGKLFDRFIK